MTTGYAASAPPALFAILLGSSALAPVAALAQGAGGEAEIPALTVTAPRLNIYEAPTGRAQTTIDRERMTNRQALDIGDVLRDSPGVSVKQGNGPRDTVLSIRGSGARQGFAVRNVVVFEDGFPVTQPDGLARTDLVDPHAYAGIDVVRGPSSALFGNYAIGGAFNFRTRRGGEIDGAEYGVEGGSYGALNNWVAYGRKIGDADVAGFASDVRGHGSTGHTRYNTQTVNLLGSYALTPDDTITVKLINNTLYTQIANRLSLNQFLTNPRQQGCAVAATAAPGCATIRLFNNGAAGTSVLQSADQAGLNRTDRRTIAGVRWEHRFDEATTWRNQFVFDDRNIDQPTSSTGGKGDFPSYNVMTDVTRHGSLFGLKATHFLGASYNTMRWSSDSYNLLPNVGPLEAVYGRLRSNTTGRTSNLEARVREEVELTERLTGVAGAGIGRTTMNGTSTSHTYAASGARTGTASVSAENSFTNAAPEVALLYRPTDAWQLHGRVGTAYGTPQLGQLFVTPSGDPGNNTRLKPQTLVGYELGADWTPSADLRLAVTGFYEFFRNELVSQTPGVGKSAYTFNAPGSEHRGVEVAADWGFAKGWRLFGAYTYNDQVFTEYTEQLATGSVAGRFDRSGRKIPGVSPHEMTARLGYDQPAGPLAGLGGFVEFVWKSDFHADNANLLKIPGYELANLNLHYTTALPGPYLREFSTFLEVRNVFDRSYVASANNVTNTLGTGGVQNGAAVLANATGSIYAGAPRTFVVGMRFKL